MESHRRFRESLSLPFPLLSDEGGRVSTLYDSVEEHLGEEYSSRKLVLVDRTGKIVYRDDELEVGDEPDWNALVAAVNAL